MITYPTTIDEFTNPTSIDTLDSPDHATQHADANNAIEALEAKVGVTDSAVATSHEYRIAQAESKLSGIEAGADVTDATNVAAAGALMASNKAASSDLNTGTDNTKYITSDGLAGSNLGIRYISQVALGADTSLTVADGVGIDMIIPPALNGMNLVYAQAYVDTAGTTNATTVQIHNVTDNTDMLSTNISIASGDRIGTAGTVNASYNDVATNDLLRIDVDACSVTSPKGLTVILGFQLP